MGKVNLASRLNELSVSSIIICLFHGVETRRIYVCQVIMDKGRSAKKTKGEMADYTFKIFLLSVTATFVLSEK